MKIDPEIVLAALRTGSVTKKEIADKAGVHKNSLQGIENPDWNPTWKTLTALCRAVEEITLSRA